MSEEKDQEMVANVKYNNLLEWQKKEVTLTYLNKHRRKLKENLTICLNHLMSPDEFENIQLDDLILVNKIIKYLESIK